MSLQYSRGYQKFKFLSKNTEDRWHTFTLIQNIQSTGNSVKDSWQRELSGMKHLLESVWDKEK
jgi:hypothetical protein